MECRVKPRCCKEIAHTWGACQEGDLPVQHQCWWSKDLLKAREVPSVRAGVWCQTPATTRQFLPLLKAITPTPFYLWYCQYLKYSGVRGFPLDWLKKTLITCPHATLHEVNIHELRVYELRFCTQVWISLVAASVLRGRIDCFLGSFCVYHQKYPALVKFAHSVGRTQDHTSCLFHYCVSSRAFNLCLPMERTDMNQS